MTRQTTPGERLRQLRKELDALYERRASGSPSPWKQGRIAARGAPPQSAQSHIERGEGEPGDARVLRLARGYGVTPDEMLRYLRGDILLTEMIHLVHPALPPASPSEVAEESGRASTPPSGRKKSTMPR